MNIVYLDEGAYDQMIESLGWDEEQPLAEYEAHFTNFYSLRKHINQLLESYLAIDAPDPENHPELHPIDDEVERSLYNSFGQIIIGNILLDYEPNGAYFIVEDPSCEIIIKLQIAPESLIGQPGIKYQGPPKRKKGNIFPPSNDCFDGKEYDWSGTETVSNGTRRTRWRVRFWQDQFSIDASRSWVKSSVRAKTRERKTTEAGKNGNQNLVWPFKETFTIGSRRLTDATFMIHFRNPITVVEPVILEKYIR